MAQLKSYFGISFLMSILIVSSGSAATYYVRTDGSDSNCNGLANTSSASSPNCAYSTVNKAASTAAAGDVVTIQAGTYSETLTLSKSGTSTAPITFKGSGAPVLKGNLTVNGNYDIIDGVTVSPPSAGGYGAIILMGQHNTLQNCLVTNYGATASDQATAIILDSAGAYNTVQGCTIKDLNDIDVFHVFGHDNTVRNNYATNIQTVNYNLNHTDFIQSYAWSGSMAYNILIEGNLFTNSTAQLGVTETDGNSALHDWTFRNNIFANIDSCFFSGVPNTYFYNNIYYNVGKNQGYAVSMLANAVADSSGSKFINNVFINNTQDVVGSVSVFTNNYFAGANNAAKSSTGSMGTNFVNGGDPMFVNVAGLDFHIQSGSVLIDKGADLSAFFTTDKEGNARSGNWDIGPYEFSSVTSGVSLQAPQNLRVIP